MGTLFTVFTHLHTAHAAVSEINPKQMKTPEDIIACWGRSY